MERLSARKRSAIVGDYLSALPYSEIAARHHVSTGTVANVVADLKAGRFPEAGDIGEQIEQLKELSLDLKQANLTPGKCAVGLMVLARINECGLDPADIDRWPLILKSIGNDDEAQEFIRLVYSIQEVQRRTGLSLDGLHDKVHELERKAAELEPISGKLADCKKQIVELTKQRRELSSEMADLEEKRKLLNPQVKDLEKREKDFSHRVAEMEPRARKAETTLSTLSQEIQKFQDIGFAFEELAEFYQRVQVVAQRHTIKPGELRGRLLHELETLDKGLGLETLIKTKQMELNKAEQAVAETKKELETTKAVVGSLTQEKADLETSIKETRERVSKEIAKLIPIAKETINRLGNELQRGNEEALAEVQRLRDEALEVGKEVGRYQCIVEVNRWLNELLSLARGEENIEGKRVRVIALLILRGIAAWLKRYESDDIGVSTISLTADNLIKELEQWKV
jgi:predicted  nucleic acid-binding Zn-ribbon protein